MTYTLSNTFRRIFFFLNSILFSAPGYDVEIQVVNGKEGISLAGQVLGAEDCAGGRVELANATTQASALINESSEFRLTTVPPGHYALLLKFAMRFSYLERVRVRVERSSPG